MRKSFAATAVLAFLLPSVAIAEAEGNVGGRDTPNAVTLFAAQLTDNDWTEIVGFNDVDMRDAYLVGVGLSRRVARFGDVFDVEVEGQLVRHFGRQDHWEANGAVIGRWTAFPWNDTLPTSFAWGVGPSYATQVPAEEVARSGESAQLLIYWVAELEVGLPDRDWSTVARLHHRSTGYGLMADDGGSNWLTLGVRLRY